MLPRRKWHDRVIGDSIMTISNVLSGIRAGDTHQCRDKESWRFWHALYPYSGVSTCQGCCRVWNPVSRYIRIPARVYTVYTPHNIPGDPPQTEPRLVSHHCALGEFMNWKRIIALSWQLDRYAALVKPTFPGEKLVFPLPRPAHFARTWCKRKRTPRT